MTTVNLPDYQDPSLWRQRFHDSTAHLQFRVGTLKNKIKKKKKGHSPLLQGVYILTGDPEKKTNYGAQAVRSKPREGGFQQVCRDREGFRGK